ncbi:hypothetical protein TI39_contig372g00026 [Zymoseptoria brevis]|uniref:Uncharacterized protein n=1 Tax=Zymoseptoria brevis TaxID=1047168 RepID=A0A0F4GQ15_9PEZI|nr:hypothetical protein TI39_contig372g00026 [Zymoseptoria brevis]
MADSNEASFTSQRARLLNRVNANARAVMEGLWDNIKKPYKPTSTPARPDDEEWKSLVSLQDKFVRWVAERRACKTREAKEELSYKIIMECREDFPKIASREFEEPDLPDSMKPRDPVATPTPEPEESAQPEAPTLPVSDRFVTAPPIRAPGALTSRLLNSAQPGQLNRAQSTSFPAIPTPQNNSPARAHRSGPIILDDDEEDGIKRERDDDYDPTLSPPPPSDAGPTPGPTAGPKDASKPKRKRQRIEDFAMLVRSEDPADLRYLRKRIINKHEAQLMQIDHQLEKLGASVEGGNEGGA